MKHYLKIALLTSVVMLLLLGGASAYLLKSSRTVQREQKKQEERQLDKRIYGMEEEDISDDDIIPLYLDGNDKNVTTFARTSVKEIYNTKNSKGTAEELSKLKKKNSYNIENPLWSYNPFGTNMLSLYLYLETAEACRLEYTIHVEDSDIVDFNRSCIGKAEGEKKHEYQILGLIPGRENYIILKYYNAKDELTARKVYRITMPKITGVNSQLMEADGKSLEQVVPGMYFFLGHDWENKKAPRGVWIYDNSGVLRGAIPTVNSRTYQFLETENGLFYNYSSNGIAKVNRLGQVVAVYKMKDYSFAGDIVYDGHGHLVFLATKKGAKTRGDRLITLDMETGKYSKAISMASLLPGVSKKKKEWLKADTMVMMGSDGVLLSSEKLSSFIRVQNIFSENPTVSYVIGPEAVWKKSELRRLRYAEEDATAEPYKPSGITMLDDSLAAAGSFQIAFYNNGKAAKEGSICRYSINEADGTYYLEDSFVAPVSERENSVQGYKGHIIVNSAEDCAVSEYDEKGKAILSLKYNINNYTPKVYKKDMKGFWFQ